MERVINATQARIHFGELMRKVSENREPVVVERDGKPHVVVISVEEYERLKSGVQPDDWENALARVVKLATRIETERGGPLLPPPEDVIREMREQRDEQLMGLR